MEEEQQSSDFKVLYSFCHVNQFPHLADYYNIYRQDGEGQPYVKVGTIPAKETSVDDEPVEVTGYDIVPECGVVYNYKVSAYNNRGEIDCINPTWEGIDFACPTATPTPTATATPTNTVTPTQSNTPPPTPTTTPTNTVTPTQSNTPPPTPTTTPTNTVTPTQSSSPPPTPTTTPTNTVTPTQSSSPPPTPTTTPTNTVTPTQSSSPPPTPTTTPTNTVTPTQSSSPPPSPTNTPTNTVTPTQSSSPPPSPTNTPTNTVTPTQSSTPPPSPTNTPTNTVTPTQSSTPPPSPTNTPTNTVTPTQSSSPTPTPTSTQTQTPTATTTPTNTPTQTQTATVTQSSAPVVDLTIDFLLTRDGTTSLDTEIRPGSQQVKVISSSFFRNNTSTIDSQSNDTSILAWPAGTTKFELIPIATTAKDSSNNATLPGTNFTNYSTPSADYDLGTPDWGGFARGLNEGPFGSTDEPIWANGTQSIIPHFAAFSSTTEGLYDFGLVETSTDTSQNITFGNRTKIIERDSNDSPIAFWLQLHQDVAENWNSFSPNPIAAGTRGFIIHVKGKFS